MLILQKNILSINVEQFKTITIFSVKLPEFLLSTNISEEKLEVVLEHFDYILR